MIVYIAGRFNKREEFREHAAELRAAGIEVTAQWLEAPDDEEWRLAAIRDIKDIDRSEIVVNFIEPKGSANVGGGRHWECGYAYAKGKLVILVGPDEEIVFHTLPGVYHFYNWDAARRVLLGAHYDDARELYNAAI
jgi:nucleoside 2-deoxyribosyltransferase